MKTLRFNTLLCLRLHSHFLFEGIFFNFSYFYVFSFPIAFCFFHSKKRLNWLCKGFSNIYNIDVRLRITTKTSCHTPTNSSKSTFFFCFTSDYHTFAQHFKSDTQKSLLLVCVIIAEVIFYVQYLVYPAIWTPDSGANSLSGQFGHPDNET